LTALVSPLLKTYNILPIKLKGQQNYILFYLLQIFA